MNAELNLLDGSAVPVPVRVNELWWQAQRLQYTASGYGKRIPTAYMVLVHGKWRRVYCCIYSNIGTLYIGRLSHGCTTVNIYN